MRIDLIQCDVCCKEHDALYVLPPEWITTIQHKSYGLEEEHHFCSVACLAQWAENQVTLARGEAPPSSTEVFQGLAERLQQLGEVPRERLTHGNWLPGDEE